MSWQEIRVGDLGEIITGKTPPTSNVDNYGGNIPFITPSDMVGNRSIVSTERYISEKGKNTIKNSILPPHAVCVSCIGSDMGKVVLTTAWSATNQQINSIVCNSHYDYRFVYYLMLTLRETIKSLGKNATAVPILNKTKFSNIQVAVPSLPIQKRIADFLSYYDDLIENNKKQIKLLEEAAQRLYKEWFVDLRFPGHETTPIVDGVPEGWRKGKISDFVPTSSGGTPSRTHSEYYSDGTNLWVKTQELNDGFIFDTEEKITDDAIRNSSAKIIPQGSILMAMYGATIGKIGIAATELTCNQACCVFNLSKIKYATSYLYCWLKDNREFFISQGKGAAQPNLSQAMIKNFDVLIPTADILTTFSQVTDTLLELSAKLHLQNRGLIEARDRLLPKLMSGEIEVEIVDYHNISELEQLISIRIMQEDTEAIFSLSSTEQDSIFAMEIIPYYALFVQSCQEYMGDNFLPEEIALRIKDIRNHIKSYSEAFGKSKRKIASIDQEQDESFKSQLRFNFLKSWNIHLNLGTYWTEDHHVIGNTQQLAAFLDAKDFSDPDLGKKQYELGYQIGSFISSVRSGLSESLGQPMVNRAATAIKIKYYYDINTNNQNSIFVDNASKELNLFYLHLLCNMNFVKCILRPLFPDGNTWVFRVEYVVTYYTFRALLRLKNYCENNTDIVADTGEIDEILSKGNDLFQSKFRNCMMHYNLQDQGVLSLEYIEKPFFGIIETCFEGMDYQTYLSSLHKMSNRIIVFLEKHFNCSSIELKQL